MTNSGGNDNKKMRDLHHFNKNEFLIPWFLIFVFLKGTFDNNNFQVVFTLNKYNVG